MAVILSEVPGATEDTQSVGILDTQCGSPFTAIIPTSRYRSYSYEELESMPAEELRRIILNKPAIVYSANGLTITRGKVQIPGAVSMRQYEIASEAHYCSTREFAKHIHTSLLQDTNVEDSVTKAKVLNIPYPVLAVYESSGSATGVLFKVPEHVATFNSESLRIKDRQYYCPALLFYAHLNASFDIVWCGVSMYTLDSPNTEIATIAHLPFPNIYANHGRICVGAMHFSSGDLRDCTTIGEACTRLVSLVLGSGWRTDLTPYMFPDGLFALWTKLRSNKATENLLTDPTRITSSYDHAIRAVLDILATPEGRDEFCALNFSTSKPLSAVLAAPDPRRDALV